MVGISPEFHQTFTQIYKQQNVKNNAEAIQEFLETGVDTKPMEYLGSRRKHPKWKRDNHGWVRIRIIQENKRFTSSWWQSTPSMNATELVLLSLRWGQALYAFSGKGRKIQLWLEILGQFLSSQYTIN